MITKVCLRTTLHALYPFITGLCLLLTFSAALSAQLPGHTHFVQFSDKDGLSSNTVYDITQNFNGEIILGTSDGISLFNGLGFRNFSYRGKGRALQNFQIDEKDSSIMASSFFGDIVRFRNYEFESILNQKNTIAKNVLFLINGIPCTNDDSTITQLGSDSVIMRFEETLQNILQVKSMPDKSFWLVSRRDRIYIEKYDHNFNLIIKHITKDPVTNPTIFQLQDSVYLFANGIIYQMKNDEFVLSRLQLKTDLINTKWLGINVFNDSLIILNGFDGVLIFDRNGGLKNELFKGISISRSFQDMEGNFWFTSLQDGIFMLPSLQLTDYDLRQITGDKNKVFRTMQGLNEEIILGTNGGKLIKVNALGDLLATLQIDRKAEIQSMTFNKDSSAFWVFCDGLFLVDYHTFRITDKDEMVSTKSMETIGDALFCATSRGLYIKGEIHKSPLSNVWINTLIKTGKKVMLGTVDGIYHYDLELDSIIKWQNNTRESPIILSFQSTKTERIFLQTLNEGIMEWKDQNVFDISIDNIPLNSAENLRISGDRLFCSIEKSVYEFDLLNEKLIAIYDQAFGIENSQPLGIFRSNDILLFVFPQTIQTTMRLSSRAEIQPWIKFRSINANFVDENKENLPFENNFLDLIVDVHPNIKAGGETKLFYKLNDTNWQPAEALGTGHNFRFQNLAPGKYQLSFKARTNNGLQSEIKHLYFKVKFPFWQSSIFIIGMISLLVFSTLIVYKRRTDIIKNRALKFLEEEKLRSRLLLAELTAIRSQMNPHFIFNVMSAIQSDILKGESRKAYDALNRFSKLLRSILEKSSKEYSPLKDEIELLELYLELEKSRFGDDFQYEMQLDAMLDLKKTRIPTLITQPFVENAIKHGLMHKRGQKKLKISFIGREDHYEIHIEDNGVGRKKSSQINAKSNKPESFATEAIRSRIDRINQQGFLDIDLEIKDLEEGTEVKLLIRKHDNED